MSNIDVLISRLEQILDRVEAVLPVIPPKADWSASAFRWRTQANGVGYLQAVKHPHRVSLDALKNIEPQKASIVRNTAQFMSGREANNVLLTGARGTGKSTLIKAVWNEFAGQGLKIIEVDKTDLLHLSDIVDLVGERTEKFIIFCDDLSFEEGEISYKALKSVLDGSIAAPTANMLFYATSNRRHLIPQKMHDNLDVSDEDGEVRPSDSIEEKVSLSERFGLWLSFYPFSQDDYLAAANYWVSQLGGQWNKQAENAALLWHRTRGARSGRVAWQFARDFVGRD
ncbi:ATP-binding protein [Cellvibrio fibrivorans]|uniref:AAA+ superfamily ATPase n=1 Tax=Cellvibrio fibrivorans TaxID=126350 RepID=A0ABU1UW85_9GAMM|nr:ATP-binding protein [Cellvibrio fibrivorans]MDR7089368.1 putative AAA+ superfamily ATPase [Cellvibrio fibrivorans]